jgi:hypothetical protein
MYQLWREKVHTVEEADTVHGGSRYRPLKKQVLPVKGAGTARGESMYHQWREQVLTLERAGTDTDNGRSRYEIME